MNEIAKLPLIAAQWYDYLLATEPLIAQMMSRTDYIDSFCRWQERPVIITSGSTTNLA